MTTDNEKLIFLQIEIIEINASVVELAKKVSNMGKNSVFIASAKVLILLSFISNYLLWLIFILHL